MLGKLDLMLIIHYIMLYKLYMKRGLRMLKNRVKELRARYGFTQSELGKQVDVTRQTIAFIEKGEFSPSITLSLKLAKVLQVEVGDLFWLEEE